MLIDAPAPHACVGATPGADRRRGAVLPEAEASAPKGFRFYWPLLKTLEGDEFLIDAAWTPAQLVDARSQATDEFVPRHPPGTPWHAAYQRLVTHRGAVMSPL